MKVVAALFGFVLAVAVTTAFVGCSKSGGGKGKVDVNGLIATLKSGDNQAQADAAGALGEAGKAAIPAVSALTDALKDDDPIVRRLAAYALGEIGAPAASAVPVLKQLLQDPVREVVTQALNSLRNIDPKSVPSVKVQNVNTP